MHASGLINKYDITEQGDYGHLYKVAEGVDEFYSLILSSLPDDVLMRFHRPDSFSPFGRDGINTYAYCQGDPVNNVDRDCHSLIRAVGQAAGLVWGMAAMFSSLNKASKAIVTRSIAKANGMPIPNDYAAMNQPSLLRSRKKYSWYGCHPGCKRWLTPFGHIVFHRMKPDSIVLLRSPRLSVTQHDLPYPS